MSKPPATLKIGRRSTHPVKSYAEASAIYCAVRDESEEGVSTFPGGVIKDVDNKTIANISYNGRVWVGDMVVCEPV